MRKLFKNPRTISAIVPPALAELPGGRLPHGGVCCMCNIGTFVRLCFGVSCGIARARSFVCNRGRACRGHVVAVAVPWPSRLWPWCRVLDVIPAVPRPWSWRCGVRRLFVAVWRLRHADECQCLQWFWRGLYWLDLHYIRRTCIVRAIKQTTTKGTEMNERPPPQRPPPQGRDTKPPNGRGMGD